MFKHKIGNFKDGVDVTFEVYDSVQSFGSRHWTRVVCLFTSGELFQLKDWPPNEADRRDGSLTDREKYEKIVNLFHRVNGFFPHYQDELEPAIVKNWNVSRLIVQRNKRHTDINIKD